MSENGDILDPEIKQMNNNNGDSGDLPNAVATLVLGILSIIGCFLFGFVGLICGIIAITLHTKDRKLYEQDKTFYANSYKTANGGYICAIIGLVLSSIYIVFAIFAIANGGGSFQYSFGG